MTFLIMKKYRGHLGAHGLEVTLSLNLWHIHRPEQSFSQLSCNIAHFHINILP
jgi:hypothetical protein